MPQEKEFDMLPVAPPEQTPEEYEEEERWLAQVSIKEEQKKCWLCGKSRPNTTITVECKTPGGKKCRAHQVSVHFNCYMDMDA